MKKAAALIALLSAFTACNSRYEQENDDKGNIVRKTTEKSPFKNYELEMKGNLIFSEDGTQITSIPEGGFAKYQYNDIHIEARRGKNGAVETAIYENGDEISRDSEKGKRYLEEAIGRMQQLQERYQ